MLFFYFQLLLTNLYILYSVCEHDMNQHKYFNTVLYLIKVISHLSNMNPWKIFVSILQLLRQPTNLSSNGSTKLHKLSIISTLCGTNALNLLQSQGPRTLQSLSNVSLIKQTIITFLSYFIGTVILSLLSMGCLLAQPFINDFLKVLIKQKINNNASLLVFEIVLIYLSFKLISSLVEIASDFCSMIFGVKFYSSLALRLIRSIGTSKMDSHFIARVQDDCQRLITMPSSITNSVIKISEFIVLSSLLLQKIPQHKIEIAFSYWIFLIISVLLAHYSWKLNLKVMHSKQKRIQFESSKQNLLRHRSEELKLIRNIIIIDGIGIIMPWILNISLTILVYGIVDMPNDLKYFVLITFGLIRTSISGLGRNLNLFAQSWSSLSRITTFLNQNQVKINSSQILIIKQVRSIDKKRMPIIKESKQFKFRRLMEICSQCVPYSNITIVFLGLLLFTSNFLYGYCAKSLLSGDSVFKTFNIISLSLSLLSPLLLYSFISYCNLKMSKKVYNVLLQEKVQKICINAQLINRLSGDIRLLDRNLYFVVYGSISHIANISASFIYTSVILENAFSFTIVLVVLFVSVMLVWLCTRLMKLRKQSYRKQSTNKGQMLQKILSLRNCIGKWKNIYTYKFYGYSIQVAFISLLYFVMILISTLIIIVLLVSQVSVEESSVLIMMISQLDSQLLYFFIQVMMLQTTTAAVNRCWSLIKNSQQNH